MRLAFVDLAGWDYHAGSISDRPLGGSQSGVCYLTEALAARGHEVWLHTDTSQPGLHRGVRCAHRSRLAEHLHAARPDALVVAGALGHGTRLRDLLDARTPLVAWLQNDASQPVTAPLADAAERDAYDGFAVVSAWHRADILEHFPVDPGRCRVLRNAIAPVFERAFAPEEAILPAKSRPPVVTYTSTPFRGLDFLVELFREIRRLVPETRLRVFSSMRVYGVAQAADEAEFGQLYRRCREVGGVELIGSVPQPVLARELRAATALTYPNTFPETSCIAVMEAMASGCAVVTSDRAALPETTAGFATLLSLGQGWMAYAQRFCDAVARVLVPDDPAALEAHLQRQVAFSNREYTWAGRAAEWEAWLAMLAHGTATGPHADLVR